MAFISKIKAGDFNIRFHIKSPSETQNSFGEKPATSYSTQYTVWAKKSVTSLRDINEKFEGDQLQSYGKFFIQIRYSENIKQNLDPRWILVDTSTNERYDILSYIIDPRKEYIELFTKIDINQSIS
jgi:head-tail adaptor|tara:strand:+ start:1173 stop:1550 length:378 start_codon:yes stop_codon:yes gene_type:complete